jgi:Tfp pilus assembly protein PilN
MKAINLLPPDLRGAPKGASTKAAVVDEPGGIGAFVVLGALAACVVALAAYVLTTNAVKDRQAKLEAATAQADAATQRVAQLKPYADFQAMAETRIQTVKDLASSRFDWEQAVRDISRAIPADVTLTSLTGTVSSGAGGGAGASPVRGAIAAPAIDLKGCTRGQKQVADLLSRLRNVDGVTRVSLGKSLKPAAAAVASATTTDAIGCGLGRPPQFELTMFFERSSVPATVQDITVGADGAQPASAGAQGAAGTATPTSVTTPPADPGATATPTPAPQGGGTP